MAVRISRNAWIGGAVGAVAVLAVGVGWALAGSKGGVEAAPDVEVTATASAEPVVASSSATAEPSASASPSAEPSDSVDPYAGDADGILDDEYPAAAATRTDPNTALEYSNAISYPDALVMEDWVWDRVGEDWAVEVVATQQYYYDEAWTQPAAVVYLVSPEEVYFEVGQLPKRMWDDARVVSWVEDEGYIRLEWADGAARYDLRTGKTEDLTFAVYGAKASSPAFVAADAAGNELWSATSDNGTKHYRWDAATGEWSASSLVDTYPDIDSEWSYPGTWGRTVSDDGELVALRLDGELDSVFVVYDLAADTSYEFTIDEASGLDTTSLDLRFADRALLVETWGADGEDTAVVSIDIDSGDVSELEAMPEADGGTWDGSIEWGAATDNAATWFACGC
ncbi:hypothetical protein [Demequina salsinemoris]|uniref:hypothetical protein n=1 Tax=Demequina salsinemoris TaxID=577470 RepID=UPI000AE814F5|nr:hypothetical protein [Demequina salsinemoris]